MIYPILDIELIIQKYLGHQTQVWYVLELEFKTRRFLSFNKPRHIFSLPIIICFTELHKYVEIYEIILNKFIINCKLRTQAL